mgnify:CR=1 FL=1
MQPECISQRASSGRLNCSCSRSRDLTAINPVVPEMMKIAVLAVSTAHNGNMSFAFSKSVPIAPAKGRGKRTPAWTNRRAKALVPCGFADAKTAKGILQYQNRRKRLSNCPRKDKKRTGARCRKSATAPLFSMGYSSSVKINSLSENSLSVMACSLFTAAAASWRISSSM